MHFHVLGCIHGFMRGTIVSKKREFANVLFRFFLMVVLFEIDKNMCGF